MIRPQTCPVCGKQLAVVADTESCSFPFCSERCRRIDFFRWSEGKYAIVEPLDFDQIPPQADTAEEES